MVGENFVTRCGKLFEARAEAGALLFVQGTSRVTRRHAGIAQEPLPLGSQHRTGSEDSAKFFLSQRKQPPEFRGQESLAWLEGCNRCDRRSAVQYACGFAQSDRAKSDPKLSANLNNLFLNGS